MKSLIVSIKNYLNFHLIIGIISFVLVFLFNLPEPYKSSFLFISLIGLSLGTNIFINSSKDEFIKIVDEVLNTPITELNNEELMYLSYQECNIFYLKGFFEISFKNKNGKLVKKYTKSKNLLNKCINYNKEILKIYGLDGIIVYIDVIKS